MHSPHPVDALASDATLHLIVDDVLDHLVDDDLPSSVVHLTIDDTGPTLGLAPLGDIHPSQLLVGFTAPDDWYAIGIATRGWAYPVGERANADRHRTRVGIVTLLSRSGELAHRSWIEPDDAIDAATRDALSTEAPAGEQMDLLYRSLGLATEAPPCPSSVYWSIEWLAGVAALPGRPTWDDVLAAHPAMALLTSTGGPAPSADFAEVATSFARVCDWARLRDLVARQRLTVPDLTAAVADWFDDGSFARYVLNRCPPLDDLRDRARGHVGPELGIRLDGVLAALGTPELAWPDALAPHGA